MRCMANRTFIGIHLSRNGMQTHLSRSCPEDLNPSTHSSMHPIGARPFKSSLRTSRHDITCSSSSSLKATALLESRRPALEHISWVVRKPSDAEVCRHLHNPVIGSRDEFML